MTHELRPATRADADFLYALHAAAMRDVVTAIWGWDEAWQRAYFAAHFAPDRMSIVEVAGRPVGMLEVEERPTESYIAKIEILPAAQGQGLGSALVREVLAAAARRGVPVRLQVLQANVRARRLYERLGFVATDEVAPHVRMAHPGAGTRPPSRLPASGVRLPARSGEGAPSDAQALPAALAAARDAMRGCPAPWAFAGGWAIDLALGTVSRAHGDVDLAAFRADQAALRAHLVGWRWECVQGGAPRPWPAEEWLAPPVHELYATSPDGAMRLEVLLNERDGADWVFRRDGRVRLPLERALVGTAAGVLALAPEVALLYKAKAPRATDEADFALAARRMDAAARAWLAEALALCHPGHRWLPSLDA